MKIKRERVDKRIAGDHYCRRHTFPARPERGIALFLSLMILALMSVLSLAMVLTVSPDMLINGYYGNFRGSFYAADSGLNIARQALVNQISSSTYVSMTPCVGWGSNAASGCTAAPLSTSSAASVIANLLASATSGGYGTYTSLNSGQALNSWPETFELVNTSKCPSTFAPVAGTPTITTSTINGVSLNTKYTYNFNYQLCSLGRAMGSQQVYTSEYGMITVKITAQSATSQQIAVSFAAFGNFLGSWPPCTGGWLIPGTYTGPMFVNSGAWQFGTTGPYTFTDPVSQTNANADFWFSGSNCIQSPTSSYKSGGTTIAPNFEDPPLNLGAAAVPVPPNDYSQIWAVLDGVGCGEGGTTCGQSAPAKPTSAQMSTYLKDINGTAYPSGGSTNPGVYVAYSCSGSCPATGVVNGGGIYVETNSSTTTNITMSLGTDTTTINGTTLLTQVYTIQQGSTTTTITIPVWNSTTNAAPTGSAAYTKISNGSTTRTLSGVPMNNVVSTSPQQATMLYVDGTISSLRGTGQGVAAVQDHTQTTIAANGTINITGDLLYAHEPVTMTGTTQTPVDSLIPANNYNQVLGVFTANGNINTSTTYSNQNVEVDGVLAAIGQNCASNSCGFTSYVPGTQNYSVINTLTNVGSLIQSNIFGAKISTNNVYFDRRFTSNSGFAPPWFPSTTMPQNTIYGAMAPAVSTPAPSRMSWSTTPQ